MRTIDPKRYDDWKTLPNDPAEPQPSGHYCGECHEEFNVGDTFVDCEEGFFCLDCYDEEKHDMWSIREMGEWLVDG